jgi:hypothetical protein
MGADQNKLPKSPKLPRIAEIMADLLNACQR